MCLTSSVLSPLSSQEPAPVHTVRCLATSVHSFPITVQPCFVPLAALPFVVRPLPGSCSDGQWALWLNPALGQAHLLTALCWARDLHILSLMDRMGVTASTLQDYSECLNKIKCVKQNSDCGLPTHCPNLFCFLSNRALYF